MAVLYKVTPVKNNLDGSGDVRYIARPAGRETADLDNICRRISKNSTLSSPDIYAVLRAFADLVPELLLDNYNVHLPPLGIFSLTFKSESHPIDEDVSNNSVKKVQMQFRPDAEIVRRLKGVKVRKLQK